MISDPLEPMNRAFFQFNDKLYFWFFKPAAKGYKTVVPETARVGVRNFFTNLTGPIRMVNCLLQGKVDEAGYEFVRLFMNTTVGLGGLLDVASQGMNLERYDEDLGQTLGAYGWEHSIFIHWPFLGPSCGRDTLGMIGDGFLDPYELHGSPTPSTTCGDQDLRPGQRDISENRRLRRPQEGRPGSLCGVQRRLFPAPTKCDHGIRHAHVPEVPSGFRIETLLQR